MNENDIVNFIEFNPFELKITQNKMDIIEKECVAAGELASQTIPPPMVYASLACFAYIAGMQAVLELYSPTMIKANVYDQIKELNNLMEVNPKSTDSIPDNVIQLTPKVSEDTDG